MAMSVPSGGWETSPQLQGFPVWPGVLVGLAVIAGLLALESATPAPPYALRRACGGPMALAHGVAAFAAVAQLGQALRVAEGERALVERRNRIARRGGLDPLLDDPAAVHADVDQATRSIDRRRDEVRRISQVVVTLVPLVGFAASVWGARPGEPWRVAHLPLFLSLAESLFVLLLNLGVSQSAQALRDGWLGLVSATSATGHRAS
jgi:hypothetical protein